MSDWGRYRRALDGRPLPAALVDLDALEANIDELRARAGTKRVRIASKSLRCPILMRMIATRLGSDAIMTYTAAESAFLVEQGWSDVLLAYPTARADDAEVLAAANQKATVAVVADAPEQLSVLAAAARARKTRIPIVVEMDVAWRPLGMHVGVRRSPLHTVAEVVELAEHVNADPHLSFAGVMAYEAHIAGLTDAGPHHRLENPARRFLKRRSRPQVARARSELVVALRAAGLSPKIVNGGGTGSVDSTASEEAVGEITIGSGFLDSFLFDYYSDLKLKPAVYFALQIVRRPAPDIVTCHGGGYIASGSTGPDRLPLPSLPLGCTLLPMEGAGEVQTPVVVPKGVELALGDPIFFRHAKAGELAEHFNEYHFVRGERVESRAPTYRGLGRCFLG